MKHAVQLMVLKFRASLHKPIPHNMSNKRPSFSLKLRLVVGLPQMEN